MGRVGQMNKGFVPGLGYLDKAYVHVSWDDQCGGVKILCENLFLREEEIGYVARKTVFIW